MNQFWSGGIWILMENQTSWRSYPSRCVSSSFKSYFGIKKTLPWKSQFWLFRLQAILKLPNLTEKWKIALSNSQNNPGSRAFLLFYQNSGTCHIWICLTFFCFLKWLKSSTTVSLLPRNKQKEKKKESEKLNIFILPNSFHDQWNKNSFRKEKLPESHLDALIFAWISRAPELLCARTGRSFFLPRRSTRIDTRSMQTLEGLIF